MTIHSKTDAELWARLGKLDEDLLEEDVPTELVETTLRQAGFDPGEVRRRGGAFVAELVKKRRLSWQERAQQRIDTMKAVARRTLRVDLAGDELRAAVARARVAAGQLNAAWRAHNDAEMSEDELRELLADLEAVVALRNPDDDDKNP